MSTANIELPRKIDRRAVEAAHAMAIEYQKTGRIALCEGGMRVARTRNPKLLKVLDQAAEIMEGLTEQQLGRSLRDPGTPHAYRVYPTEAALWREAYRLCDEGRPIENLGWIYGAAAYLAGLLH